MSEMQTGLKTFTGLASYFTKIFEILDRMRREDIKILITPLHDEFVKINMNYFDMFYRLRTKIRGLGNAKLNLDEFEFSQELKKIIDDFEKERGELEPFRDIFQQKIKGYLEACQDPHVQNYIGALGFYFSHPPTQTFTDSPFVMQMDVRGIIERGGVSALPTPSSKLLSEIKNTRDLSKIKSTIAETCEGVAINMSIVSRYYYSLEAKRI
ncbi:hypothetical protein FF100_21320 [Methylobacterium terricola]|uniref:Uncharacterized protein n=1 Tax=Methylobacterium terricola TaxID=2583531 RepID=A0A5C4LEN4_9HYPH|nr:hypothetical protein [Methylobacterium terricola]TNC10705.1 hypothetical protein FF100_21320 [Methylobacterium terricola]